MRIGGTNAEEDNWEAVAEDWLWLGTDIEEDTGEDNGEKDWPVEGNGEEENWWVEGDCVDNDWEDNGEEVDWSIEDSVPALTLDNTVWKGMNIEFFRFLVL